MNRRLPLALFAGAAIAGLLLSGVHLRSVRAQEFNPFAYPVGPWYGNAKPVNPATSPFPEVVMIMNFQSNGVLVASDSIELNNPHTTAHGRWVRTGTNAIRGVFMWINLDGTPGTNGFAGTFKVILDGSIDTSASPHRMLGTLHAYLFPPGTDPLAPNNAGGVDVGVFRIENMRRMGVE